MITYVETSCLTPSNSSSTSNTPKLLKRKTVSVIVPIFDEEKTIGEVASRLIAHPLIDEVICVNDGSTDRSLSILEKFGNKITVINLDKNHGKGYALARGIENAKGEIVAFFDADLINLQNIHIDSLIKFILNSKKTRAVLGYPTGKSTISNYLCMLFKDITGERVYYKNDLLPHLSRIAKTRFGVEIYLNNLFKQHEIKTIPLRNLYHLFKQEKYNRKRALQETMKEIFEVIQEIGRREGLLPRDTDIPSSFKKALSVKEIKKLLKSIV